MHALALLGLALVPQASPASAESWTWRRIDERGAPSAREAYTAVAAGDRLVVWGGRELGEDSARYLDDGARLNLDSLSWQPIAAENPPSARAWHAATWTGERMIVVGGQDEVERRDAGAYDPESDRWWPLPTDGGPEPRVEALTAWTGREILVFGGVTEHRSFTGGARLDPGRGRWTPLEPAPLPYGPRAHGGVWTGRELLVFGGINGGRVLRTGLAYDPRTDRWRTLATEGMPTARGYPGVVWTGERMIVFGGRARLMGTAAEDLGGLYDPAADRWEPLPHDGAPAPRHGHVVAWTGSAMVVFGGTSSTGVQEAAWRTDAASFDLASGRWTPLPAAPVALIEPRGVWTSRGLVVVGRETDRERLTTLVLAPDSRPPPRER